MQVGDLVRVKNSTTGDAPNMVRLYRDKVPLLVLSCPLDGEVYPVSWMAILLDSTSTERPQVQIDLHRLEVISSCR